MNKQKWTEVFEPEALKKGYRLSHAVDISECNEYGFNGSVFDHDENYCMVNFRDGLIEDMKCSSEDDIYNCAYLAAMLYHYDPDQKLEVGYFFDGSFDEEVDDCVDEMLEKASSYKEIDVVVEKTENYMSAKIEEFVEKSQYETALRFSFCAFGFLSLLIDEYFDGFDQQEFDEEIFFKKIQNKWRILIEDMDDKKAAFKQLERIFHYPYSKSFEDYLTEIFLECFNEEEFYEDRCRVVNHMLLGSKANEDMWDVRMQYDDWMEIGLELMVNAHRSHHEILQFFTTYHEYSQIFIDYADICLKEGYKGKAIEVLDLGLKYHHDDEYLKKKKRDLLPSLRLDISTWADQFTDVILKRGYSYFDHDKISQLKQEPYGIGAIIKGTENYHVTIDLKDKQVTDMYCDCPYASQGHNCKHMAAALFACSDLGSMNDVKQKIEEKRKQKIKEMIENTSRSKIDEFLFDELSHNEILLNKFKNALKTDNIQYKYIDYLESLFHDYHDQVPVLVTKTKKYLHIVMDKILSANDYQTAYRIITYTISVITSLKSQKNTSELMKEIQGYMKRLVQINPDKEQAFKDIKKLYRVNNNLEYEYLIDDLLLGEFNDDYFYSDKLDLINQKIMYSSLYDDQETQHYMYERWTKYGLELLIASQKEEAVILAYVDKYADSKAVQLNYCDYYVEKGDYNKALEILDQYEGEAFQNKKQEIHNLIKLKKHVS